MLVKVNSIPRLLKVVRGDVLSVWEEGILHHSFLIGVL